jgi:yersiniabactin nonribosomal peptide synthetase
MTNPETDRMARPRTPRAEDIRADVAAKLGIPAADIGFDDDLAGLGLDSLGVMTLASAWQAAGVDVTFGDLIEEATITAWARLTDGGRPAATAASTPAEHLEAFDLAPMQHAYWSSRQPGMPLRSGSHFYFEFDAALDTGRLDRAVRALRRRHPMLRTRVDGDGIQRIRPDLWGLDEVVDLRELDTGARHQRLADLRARMSHQTLRVEEGRGLDVRLVRLAEDACRLCLDIDMIVCDAGSFRIVVSDLARLYAADGADAAPLDLRFPDYLRLVEQSGRRRDRDVEYWRNRAESLPTAPSLPLASAPERLDEVVTVRRHAWLPGESYARLTEHARTHRVTTSMALAAVYADVLAAWSDDPHFLLNLPVLNRVPVHPDVDDVVGDFTDLLLLETRPDAARPFVDRARTVQEQYRRDAAHSSYGGTSVLRDLARTATGPRNRSGVVFTSALSLGELFDPAAVALLGQPVWMSSQTPGVWIDLQLVEQDGGMLINWETTENLFSEGVPAAMFDAFVDRVRLLASAADAWSQTLPVPVPAGQVAVRARVNATERAVEPRLLHLPVFAHADSSPERVAVRAGDLTLSYSELATRALAVAGLLRDRGVSDGEPVAVSIPKGPDQIVAVLGVLAAGGCYVPIGVEQPPPRRNRILTSAGARLALVTHDDPDGWPEQVELVDLAAAVGHEPLDAPIQTSPDELAYVIYTSGSTGEPKGVEVTHAAAANTIDAVNDRYGIGPDDSVLAVSALDFDLSVYDIFGLLGVGGQVVTITEDTRREAAVWADLMHRHRITVWNTVPTLLDMLLIAGDSKYRFPGLRVAMVSGDWVGLDLMDRLHAIAPGARLVAMGGATEAAIWSNVFDVDHVDPEWVSIPYGKPLPNQRFRVVDPYGRDRPDWVPGELWIGGAGVARGYRADPDRTAASFVTVDGQRWYRTGDRGRYHPDGNLEFLGRTDHQVKIRGHRIELGEIETRLRELAGVTHVAVWVEDSGPGRRLVAAVAGTDLRPGGVRAALVDAVPGYMIPEHIHVLDAMPLNANGKVDRAALARIAAPPAEPSAAAVPPRSATERAVAEIWQDLLQVAEVSRDTGFFELGGDSLTAIRVAQRLDRRFGVELTLRQLFDHPTLTQVAALVDELTRGSDDRDAPVRLEEGVL